MIGRLYDPTTRTCKPAGDPVGLVPGGSDADQNELGVRNLGGSLSEALEDAYADYSEPCWHDLPFAARDPVCTIPGAVLAGPTWSARGGSWLDDFEGARTCLRGLTYSDGELYTGFRCARSADTEADR